MSDAAIWLLLLAVGLGVATAYLIVAGSWHIALGLIALLPALILLHRCPFLALLAWLALAQFLMTTDTTTERTIYWMIHRALPPVTVGIIVLSFCLGINQRKLSSLGVAELAMAGYLIVSLASIAALNDSPQATMYLFYDRVFSPMCLYMIARLSAPGERDLRRLAAVAIFVGVAQTTIGLLSWFAPQVLPPDWLDKAGIRTTGSLVNTGTYSVALIFAGLLILQAAVNRKPGFARTLYVCAFVLILLCDFLSLSRASWLGAILVFLGLLFLYPRFLVRLCLIGVPALLILGGGLLADQISVADQRLRSEESERSALSRLPVFYAAYQMFQAKPWFGWGYGNFDRYDRQFHGRVLELANDNKDHASHNFYLTLIAEQGLIGFALFLAPLAWWLVQTTQALPRLSQAGVRSRNLLVVLWFAVLNQIIVSNFTNMRVVYGLGVWWITLGLIAGLAEIGGQSGSVRPIKDVARAPEIRRASGVHNEQVA